MAAADQLVTIPMQGSASSLNIATAASLMLYELRRTNTSHRTPFSSADRSF